MRGNELANQYWMVNQEIWVSGFAKFARLTHKKA